MPVAPAAPAAEEGAGPAAQNGAGTGAEELEQAESRARAAEQALNSVVKSASWRITRPLRKARDWFR
jgi:hypothetical protein